jgi:hypothetical protein
VTERGAVEALVVIGYWIVAGLFGVFYLYAGGKNLTQTQHALT